MPNRYFHQGCECPITKRLSDFHMTAAQCHFERNGNLSSQIIIVGSACDVVLAPDLRGDDDDPTVWLRSTICAVGRAAGVQYVTAVLRMATAEQEVEPGATPEEIQRVVEETMHLPSSDPRVQPAILSCTAAVDPLPAYAALARHYVTDEGAQRWTGTIYAPAGELAPLREAMVTGLDCSQLEQLVEPVEPGVAAVRAALNSLPFRVLSAIYHGGFFLMQERATQT